MAKTQHLHAHPRRSMRASVWSAVCGLLLTAVTLTAAGGGATAMGDPQFEPLASPQRIADTRANGETVDGQYEATGKIAANTTMELQVAGRAGVSTEAVAVTLNVTAAAGAGPGFLAVFPCDQSRPNSSNVNYFAGTVSSNAVFAGLDGSGKTCIYALTEVHIIVDVNGWMPAGVFDPLAAPQRIADTRPNGETADGANQATGRVPAGTALTIQVAGRAGIASDATAVVLNVTVANGASPGFLAAYPCDQPRPNASNVNYTAGQITANSVIAKLDGQGRACVFSLAAADVIVDVSGSLAPDFFVGLNSPQRIVDSRPLGETVDGDVEQDGFRRAGTTLQFPVVGRAGVPAGASAVALNVTVTKGAGPGFLTLHPRNSDRPNASNVNYYANTVNANLVIAGIGGGGSVCLYTSADVEVIVDVAGYYVGEAPVDTGDDCPFEFPIRSLWDGYPVGEYHMPPGRYVSETPFSSQVWCETNRREGRTFQDFINGTKNYGNHVTVDGRHITDVRSIENWLDFSLIWGTDTVKACEPLVPYVAPTSSPASSFGPGDHVVGQHIQTGTYQGTSADFPCKVLVLSSFDGTDGSKLRQYEADANGNISVFVSGADQGVSAGNGCNTLSK